MYNYMVDQLHIFLTKVTIVTGFTKTSHYIHTIITFCISRNTMV